MTAWRAIKFAAQVIWMIGSEIKHERKRLRQLRKKATHAKPSRSQP